MSRVIFQPIHWFLVKYIYIDIDIDTTIFDQIGGAYCEAPLKDKDFILGSFERTTCKLGIGIDLKILNVSCDT